MGEDMVCFSEGCLKDMLLRCYDRAIDADDSFLFESLCDAISTLYCINIVSADLYDFTLLLSMQLGIDRLQRVRDELEEIVRGG